jgi:hypothetical protein
MTTTDATSPGSTTEPTAQRPAWLVPALILLATVVALLWAGRQDPDAVQWTTGHASVTGTQATIDADGWTFGPASTVNEWIDQQGSRHQASWPDCLPDGMDGDVRVAWVPYELDGGSSRVIVAVDCQV